MICATRLGQILWEIKDFYNYIISIIAIMQPPTTNKNVKSFSYVIGALETIQKSFSSTSTIKKNLQEAIGQLKKMREALTKVNDWENPNCEFQEVTELSEIVKFFTEVSADISTYCKKYLGPRSIKKDQIKYQAKFWGKVRDVINNAKQKAEQQSKPSLITSSQKIQKIDQPLKSSQITALVFIFNQLIKGGIQKSYNGQKLYYTNKLNQFVWVQEYLNKFQLKQQAIQPIINQILSLEKLQANLLKITGLEKVKNQEISKRFQKYIGNMQTKLECYQSSLQKMNQRMKNILGQKLYNKTKQEDTIELCSQYIQKIQQKMIKYKANEFNQQKISALKQVQKSILNGSKQSALHSYYEGHLSYSKGIQILSPLVEDYKKITQVIEKLTAILQNKNDRTSVYWQNLSQRCLTLVSKLQTEITLKAQQIYSQIDPNWPYGKTTTLDGFFRLLPTWKSAIQKKINSQKTEPKKQQKYNYTANQTPTSQRNKSNAGLWKGCKTQQQLAQLQKLKQQVQVQVMAEKIHEIRQMLRKQIFKQIGQAAQLRWLDFKDKYNKRLSQNIQLPCQNFSVADDIICKVLKSTALALQVPKNSSIFQLLESGQQKQKTIDQLRKTNTELGVQIEKLQNFIKVQQQQGNIQYDNSEVNKAVIRPLSKLKTAQNRIAQLQQQIVHEKKLKQEFAQLNSSLNKRMTEIQSDLSKLKQQGRTLQLNYEKKLKQKQTQIQKFSSVLVSSSNNSNSLKDKQITSLRTKVTTLTQQVQDQTQVITDLKDQVIGLQNQLTKQKQNATKRYNQAQAQKTKAEELQAIQKADIAECIEVAKNIIDDSGNITGFKDLYSRMAEELKYFKPKKKQYKSLYEQALAEGDQSLTNIKQILNDNSINKYSDVENKIQLILRQKQELEKFPTQQLQKNQHILSQLKQLVKTKSQENKQQQPEEKKQARNYQQIHAEIISILDKAIQVKNSNTQLVRIQDNTKMFVKEEDQLYVVYQLQKYLDKKSLSGFNLLYRSSQGNIKAALDKKANTLLLIKTKNGNTIGCYASRSYCGTRDYASSKGLLISTFSKSAYPLKLNYCPIEPSEEYLIFGNSTIKLTQKLTDTPKISIKFDYLSAFDNMFNKTKHTQYNICGENTNQVDIEGFEVYQIEIEGKDDQIVQIKPKVQPTSTPAPTASKLNQGSTNIRPTQMNQPKKSESMIQGDDQPIPRNLSSTKYQKMYKDMKDKVDKYEKSIRTLNKRIQTLLEVIKKYEPNYDEASKPKQSPPKKQNQNRSQTVRILSTPTPDPNSNNTSGVNPPFKDEMSKQITDLKQALQQKQLKLQQAAKKVQIAEQQTNKYSEQAKKAKEDLAKLQQTLDTVNVKLNEMEKEKQDIIAQMKVKDQQITRIQDECKLLKQQISASSQPKQQQQERQASLKKDLEIEKIQKDLVEITQQRDKINQEKSDLSAQISELKNKLAQLQMLLKAQIEAKSNQTKQEPKETEQKIKENQEQQIKPQESNNCVQIKTDQSQQNLHEKQNQQDNFSKQSQGQTISQQQPQAQRQKKQEGTNLGIELIAGAVISIEKEQAKKVQELLTSAHQIKQAYKKLKQKQGKITKIIDEKQKRIVELDGLIEKKILQRTNIQFEISQMSDKIDQIKNMKQEIDTLNREKFKIKQGIENDKLASSKEIEKEKQELAKMRRQSKQAIQKQKQELAKIKGQSTKNKQEIEKTKNAINSALTKRNDIQKQFTAKQKVIRQLVDKETKMAQKLKKLEQEFEQKNKEKAQIDEMLEKMQKAQKQLQDINEKVKKQRDILSQLQNQYSDKQIQLQQINRQLNSLSEARKQYNQIDSKLKKMKVELNQKQNQITEISRKINEAQQKQKIQRKQAEDFVKSSENQVKQAKNNIQRIRIEEKNATIALKEIQAKLYDKKRQNLKYGGFPNRYFVGQVLQNELDRQFILEVLGKMYPTRSISKTKFLFSYPLMKDINPHLCIDEIPNYIIIMKLDNKNKRGENYLVSMYSERPLSKTGGTNNGKGFIASVTNRKPFYLKSGTTSNPRVTQYNEFYIIFGNGELRFRLGSNDLETNIGHMYKSFDTQDHKNGEIFTGTTQQISTIESYEIYQLLFDKQY